MAQTKKLTENDLKEFITKVARGEEVTKDEAEAIKDTFRQSQRDGSLQRRVLEAAMPAIKAEERIIQGSVDRPGQRAL